MRLTHSGLLVTCGYLSARLYSWSLFLVTLLCPQPPMTEANSADGPYAVVLAPTRELAQQIEEETAKLAEFTP